MKDQRCVLMAVDRQNDIATVRHLIGSVMYGPMGPFIAGVKFNDALHMKRGGHLLVNNIYEAWPDFMVFVDLELVCPASTAVNMVERYYRDDKNLLVTASVHSDAGVFLELQKAFPQFNTGERSSAGLQIAVMGIPTDMSRGDCKEIYDMYPVEAMERWLEIRDEQFKRLAEKAYEGSRGMHLAQYAISSFDMLNMVKERFPWVKSITPGIRDVWMLGNRGGQKRIVGVANALKAGASYVVLGDQLFEGDPAFAISAEESQRLTANALKEYFAEAA